MKLSEINHNMLKKFSSGSKNISYFCTGNAYTLAQDVAKKHFDELHTAGLIRPVTRDSYTITLSGLRALDTHGQSEATKAQQRHLPGEYVPPKLNIRADGNDHLNYASLPMSAQIVRASQTAN